MLLVRLRFLVAVQLVERGPPANHFTTLLGVANGEQKILYVPLAVSLHRIHQTSRFFYREERKIDSIALLSPLCPFPSSAGYGTVSSM